MGIYNTESEKTVKGFTDIKHQNVSDDRYVITSDGMRVSWATYMKDPKAWCSRD